MPCCAATARACVEARAFWPRGTHSSNGGRSVPGVCVGNGVLIASPTTKLRPKVLTVSAGSRVCHCLGVVRARRVPPAPPMCMVITPAARRGRPVKGAGLANAPKLSRAGACSKTMGLQVLSWIPWWFSPPPIKMVQPCSSARPWRGECAAHSFLPAPCPCCSCWSPVRRALKPTPIHLRIAAWFQGGRVSG